MRTRPLYEVTYFDPNEVWVKTIHVLAESVHEALAVAGTHMTAEWAERRRVVHAPHPYTIRGITLALTKQNVPITVVG